MLSSQRGGPCRQKWCGMKQENTLDFIEGKDWGPSYRNLESFVLFSKFCNQSCSTRTRSQASAIVIDMSHRSNKQVPLLFWFTPPLWSRSRVDFGEFFGKQGCHRLSPTSGLSVSIRHDLYFVCKATSVRSDLLQALYKLVIVSWL